ncbi:hypothetical protein FOA52_014156 [Chlamydomonas sp. UWO 241]|nr:hypothetical protein FOA52_014156 [Chlamydomonas sp. UWO 241]
MDTSLLSRIKYNAFIMYEYDFGEFVAACAVISIALICGYWWLAPHRLAGAFNTLLLLAARLVVTGVSRALRRPAASAATLAALHCAAAEVRGCAKSGHHAMSVYNRRGAALRLLKAERLHANSDWPEIKAVLLPDRLMASPVPPHGPPPVRAPDDNPASSMLVDDDVELVPPPAEEPKKRNAFDLMKASNLKAAQAKQFKKAKHAAAAPAAPAQAPEHPPHEDVPPATSTATPAADGPTIDATPIATSVKKKPPSSEAQKSWIKTFPFIFIATAVNLATNGAVLVGCSVCREIYGANSNKSYAAGTASVYSLNDLTKHSKCDEHKDAVDAKVKKDGAPPPAKVKFFKGNFKMTTAYKFAADFADAAIESLKESFFDDDPSLDILACFTIFDPVQYIAPTLMVPNIILLMNVYYVMALHTAEVERGFSIHRILKNRLRSRLMILMVDSLLRIWHLAQSFTGPRESEINSLINEAAEKLSGASLQSQGGNPPSLLKRLVEEVSRVQVSFLDRDLDEAARLLEKEGLEDVNPAVAFDVEGNIVEEEDAGPRSRPCGHDVEAVLVRDMPSSYCPCDACQADMQGLLYRPYLAALDGEMIMRLGGLALGLLLFLLPLSMWEHVWEPIKNVYRAGYACVNDPWGAGLLWVVLLAVLWLIVALVMREYRHDRAWEAFLAVFEGVCGQGGALAAVPRDQQRRLLASFSQDLSSSDPFSSACGLSMWGTTRWMWGGMRPVVDRRIWTPTAVEISLGSAETT